MADAAEFATPDGPPSPGVSLSAVDRTLPALAPAEARPVRVDPAGDDLAPLVSAAIDGDERAFARLVEATHRDVFTLARRLTGDDEDARDVTQEAYLRAFKGIGGFRGDSMFSTWMYRITANCAATYLGRRSRHRHEPLPHSDVADTDAALDPQAHTEAGDTREQLLVALDALPPKLRAVMVLRDVYELPHSVIGEELGISAAAAKVRLHRARRRLRSELHPELDEVDSRAL